MNDPMIRRGVLLALLGLGVFFLVATFLGLAFWLVSGTWEMPIQFVAAVSLVLSMPIAYGIWKRFLTP